MLINNEFIHVVDYPVSNPKASVVLLHGIAEHHLRYQRLIKNLNNNDYNVIAFDLRGHGKSGGKRGYIKNVNYFINDLKEVINYTYRNYDNDVFIIGHSLGALIANLYAIDYDNVKGIVVSGSAGDFAKGTNLLRILPTFLYGFKKIKTNFQDPNLNSNATDIYETNNDNYLLNEFSLKLIAETMIKGIRKLKKEMSKITIPYLVLHGESDKVITLNSNNNLYIGISSENKHRITYPNFGHNILNDLNNEKIFQDITTWLDKQYEKV